MAARKKKTSRRRNGATKSAPPASTPSLQAFELSEEDQETIKVTQDKVQDLKIMYFDMLAKQEQQKAAVKAAIAQAEKVSVDTLKIIGTKHGGDMDNGKWNYDPKLGVLSRSTA